MVGNHTLDTGAGDGRSEEVVVPDGAVIAAWLACISPLQPTTAPTPNTTTRLRSDATKAREKRLRPLCRRIIGLSDLPGWSGLRYISKASNPFLRPGLTLVLSKEVTVSPN
jgi:hypothetical protein